MKFSSVIFDIVVYMSVHVYVSVHIWVYVCMGV